jgi:hypothetical protein
VTNKTGSTERSITTASVEILLMPKSPDMATSSAPPIILKKPSIDAANPAQYLKDSRAREVAEPDKRLNPTAPKPAKAKKR